MQSASAVSDSNKHLIIIILLDKKVAAMETAQWPRIIGLCHGFVLQT